MSLKDITKEIQFIVGTTADGIWGINTANAVLKALKGDIDQEETDVEDVLDGEGKFVDLYPDDLINERVHSICVQVLNVFETGTKTGNYAGVSIYADGPNKARQITYGRSQTTESGNLKKLLEKYLSKNPTTAASAVIKNRIAKVGKTPYMVNDTEFINALKAAGKEELMIEAQDQFFDEAYFNPAYKWFHTNGFTLPLSMLVIYDSFIHSGGILSFLRTRFSAVPPAKGGNEKTWIKEYVRVRRAWLASHSNTILRKTVYRMTTMERAMSDDNWMLDKPVYANGVIVS